MEAFINLPSIASSIDRKSFIDISARARREITAIAKEPKGPRTV